MALNRTERTVWISALFLLWAVPLLTGALQLSFWLDETISLWITNGSSARVLSLTKEFQGQSPLYYLILWGWEGIVGRGEMGVRLLSLILLGGSAALLFEMVSRRSGILPGVIAVCLFWGTDITQQSLSARPYALATFFVLVALRGLLGGRPSLLLYFFASLLAFYSHYLFGLVFILPWLLYVAGARERPLWMLGVMTGLQLIAAIPGLSHLLQLAARSSEVSFLTHPSFVALVTALFPLPQLLIVAFAGAVAAVLYAGKGLVNEERGHPSAFFWLLAWFLPPIIFFVASLLGPSVFSGRYFGWYALGFSAFVSLSLGSYLSTKALRLFAAVVFAFTLYREIERRWIVEDWRGAAHEVRRELEEADDGTRVFLYSGLAEAGAIITSSLSTDKKEYLSVPFQIYAPDIPVEPLSGAPEGRPQMAVALGSVSTQALIVYLKRKLPDTSETSEEVIRKAAEEAGLAFSSVKEDPKLPVRVARVTRVAR